jgi:hypothetical protein
MKLQHEILKIISHLYGDYVSPKRLLSVDNTYDQRAYCDVTGTEKEWQSQPPGVCKILFPGS